MISIQSNNKVLGATVTGVDLQKPLAKQDFIHLLKGLGQYGVLCFPNQIINAKELKEFSQNFGGLHTLSATKFFEPGLPEVTILSNIKINSQPIGAADAGQFWHTDMAYNKTVGFVNVLSAEQVPTRHGISLGATEFVNTHLAYEELSEPLKAKLADAIAIHDLNKSWEQSRKDRNSNRPPLTEAQRRDYPPVEHPVFMTHPITQKKVIYVTPSYTEFIKGMDADESQVILHSLIDHILNPKYRYTHHWTVNDVLMWDHLGTWHNAISDYRPDESRLMKRCQVIADRIFDPAFLKENLSS